MVKKITLLFVVWRVTIFFIASLGDKFLSFNPRFPYAEGLLIPSKLPSFIWSFANFDGVHYITIAKTGYSAQFTQVFFPLFPLIVGGFSRLLADNYTIITGLIISNVAFLCSLYVFQKLLSLDYKSSKTVWIIVFLLVFPLSFYFGSYYTESLFFLFLVSSLYASRKKKWWIAGILGALASATKLFGIFLLPALLWEVYQANKKVKDKNNIKNFIKAGLRSPVLYITPLGLLIYMAYLQFQFSDALYFWHAQPVFGAQRTGNSIILLPQVLFRYIKILTSVPVTLESFWIPFLEVSMTVISLGLLVLATRKKVRPSYTIFSFLAVLIPTMTGTLSSMPRYVLIAFPMYIVLGLIKNTWVKCLLLAGMTGLLVVLTMLFTHGVWVS